MKHIKNPLTIIAIFSTLAEAAGVAVLPFVSEELQRIFIWYVIGFPILLVILFFITLNFNRQALYAPSDYKNESNFIKLFFKNMELAIEEKSKTNPEFSNSLKMLDEIIEKSAIDMPQDHFTVYTNYSNSEGKENDDCGNLILNGKRIRIWQNKTIIGKSSDADICIKDLTISRIHCIIYREKDKYFLQDAHSTNGTIYNSYVIKQDSMVELRENSIIIIGNVPMRFETPSKKEDTKLQRQNEKTYRYIDNR